MVEKCLSCVDLIIIVALALIRFCDMGYSMVLVNLLGDIGFSFWILSRGSLFE